VRRRKKRAKFESNQPNPGNATFVDEPAWGTSIVSLEWLATEAENLGPSCPAVGGGTSLSQWEGFRTKRYAGRLARETRQKQERSRDAPAGLFWCSVNVLWGKKKQKSKAYFYLVLFLPSAHRGGEGREKAKRVPKKRLHRGPNVIDKMILRASTGDRGWIARGATRAKLRPISHPQKRPSDCDGPAVF